MVRTSPRKKKQSVISFEKATSVKPKTTSRTTPTNGTPNGVKKETVATTTKAKLGVAKSATPKRKAPQIDEDEYKPDVKPDPSEVEPAAKKQKTKGVAGKAKGNGKTKEEDMKPLASRTAVESLKKAMYIGAHISAAGGSFSNPTPVLRPTSPHRQKSLHT